MISKTFPLIAIISLIFMTTPVHAADNPATPSSTIDQSSIEQSIQQRIKKAIEDNLSTAKKELGIDQNIPRSVVGTAKSLSQNSINLQTAKSEIIQLLLDQNSNITKNNKTIKTTEVSIGDHLLCIGTFTNPQTFTVKKLIVYTPTTPLYQRSLVHTTISAYSSKTREITTNLGSIKLGQKPRIFNADLTQTTLADLKFPVAAALVTYTNAKTSVVTISRILVFKQDLAPTVCGDKVCAFTCSTSGCKPESPETCPADCNSAK